MAHKNFDAKIEKNDEEVVKALNRFDQDVKKILCEERQKNWSRQLKLILLTLILSYSSFFIEFYYENKKSDEEIEKKLKGVLYYFFIFGLFKGNNSAD